MSRALRPALFTLCGLLSLFAQNGWLGSPPRAAARATEGGALMRASHSAHDALSGEIQITLDQTNLQTGQDIGATVLNGGDTAIYAYDEQTDCSVLTVLRWDGTAWQPMPGCGLRRLPRAVSLAAGEGVDVAIDAYSPFLGGSRAAGVPAFGEGWYCLELDYRLGVPGDGTSISVAYSEPFYIAAAGG